MSAAKTEIRTLLSPVEGGSVLLPGSVVAEVIACSELKPFKGAPAWLLGTVEWNDWNIPVVSFAGLGGTADDEKATAKSRVLVLKSLSESSSTPYLGILISGLPRLLKVNAAMLEKPERLADYPSVFRQITIGEQQALIPELDELTRIVEEALEIPEPRL